MKTSSVPTGTPDVTEGQEISEKLYVMANYPYQSDKKGFLCIEKGDIIRVTKKSDTGWWTGELNGKKGKFPEKYTSPHEKK